MRKPEPSSVWSARVERRAAASSVSASRRGVEQVGEGALAGAADPAADLVGLGEAELVGALDDQRVGGRDVEARLDDRRRHQAVGVAAQEGEHRLLQRAARPSGRALRGTRASGPGRAGARPPRAASRSGCGGRRPGRRARSRARSPCGPGPRRRGRRRCGPGGGPRAASRSPRCRAGPARLICRVRGIGVAESASTSTFSFSWRSSSFCLTPKRCSSSTTTRPRSLARTSRESSRWVPIRMSTLPASKSREHRFDLGRRAQPRDALDPEREVGEPLAEGAEVLLGEDRGRHQHHHLLAVGGGLDRGAQRHLGLAEADVAADQAVHRPLRFHVALDRLDRLDLVGGLAVGEGRLHRDLPLAVGREGVALAGAALGVEVEQFAGQRAGRFARPRLQVLPAFAAERRERRFAAGADVAAQLRQLFGGDVDAVLAFVFEVEVVAGDAADLARLEAGEAGDAVVLVDDVVADPQLAEGEAAAAGRRRRLLGAAAPVDEAAEGIDGELQLGATKPSRRRASAKERPGSGERRPPSRMRASSRSSP